MSPLVRAFDFKQNCIPWGGFNAQNANGVYCKNSTHYVLMRGKDD
jgi:hypothetical protein